jgi:signal transduction histidine kinase
VRYNEPGGTLAIETKTVGAFALLVVANDGPALAESEVEALFEPFRRGDASRSREAGGAGLGLSITRAIAQTHGGAVEAQARTEGGLRVTVRLRAVRRPDESGSLPERDHWQRVAGWA